MEHTQGTWRVTGTGTIRYIDVAVGNGMVQEVATCMRTEYGDMEANARRIVACVNACRGIRTEALEHRVHLLAAEDDTISLLNAQLATERATLFAENQRKQQLERQVCTLLGALELLLCDVEEAEYMTGREREVEARAVIQKVRGGEC